MKFLLTNLVFTLIWGAISASFTPANLLLGFAAGALSLWLIRRELRPVAYPLRPLRLLLLASLFSRSSPFPQRRSRFWFSARTWR